MDFNDPEIAQAVSEAKATLGNLSRLYVAYLQRMFDSFALVASPSKIG